jgi:L-malate glycosyltransferase
MRGTLRFSIGDPVEGIELPHASMRILHTVEFYHPLRGGAETVVRRLSEGLAAKGHQVTVATSAHPARRPVEQINGVEVRGFDITGNRVKGYGGKGIQDYRKWVMSRRWDVILVYALQSWPGDLIMEFAEYVKCPALILAPCGCSGLRGLRSLLYRSYYRTIEGRISLWDSFVVHSSDYIDAAWLHDLGVERIHVIPNGVDVGEFPPAAFPHRESGRNPFRLVCIGNHYWVKGHDRLLRLLPRIGNEVEIRMVGGRPAKWYQDCSKLCAAAARGYSGLTLIDGSKRGNVLASLAWADALVLPSRVEAFPLVVLEALAAGRPYVSWDVGAVKEIPGGLLVSNAAGFRHAVRTLTEDDRLYAALVDEGREAVRQRYDWDQIVDQYECAYRSCLGAS